MSQQLQNTGNDPLTLLRQYSGLLGVYVNPHVLKVNGCQPEQWVDRVVAAVDQQIRALTKPVSAGSVLLAVWQSISIGLVPHGGVRGSAFLVPFGGHATLIVGVRGWRELAGRSGIVQLLTGIVVEGDEIDKRAAPPFHVPCANGDAAVPETWEYGYAQGEALDAQGNYRWLAPLWVSGTELRRRLAKVRQTKLKYGKAGYETEHPGQWGRNRMCRAYCTSDQFALRSPELAIASASLTDMSGAIRAGHPQVDPNIAEDLAAAVGDMSAQGDDAADEPEDMSPAAQMERDQQR